MEKLVNPRRRTPFEATKRAVGFVILLLGVAYLEEDSVLLCISLAAAIVSLSITAATVWATVRTAGLVDGFLLGI